jgi:DNA topoisomerase-3
LIQYDFPGEYNNWKSCDPFVLFDLEIETKVAREHKAIEQNLVNEAKNAQTLMIWTDCDREGENIGYEIASICRGANRHISVKRARFSALIAQ